VFQKPENLRTTFDEGWVRFVGCTTDHQPQHAMTTPQTRLKE
jgi:hypothetical protein